VTQYFITYHKIYYNSQMPAAAVPWWHHWDVVLQLESAPALHAHATVEYLLQDTPEFILPYLWPPNSLDLNPVDYKVWDCIQDQVYQKHVYDVNELKQHLVKVQSDLVKLSLMSGGSEFRPTFVWADNRETPCRAGSLSDSNFITRMIYSDCYWLSIMNLYYYYYYYYPLF